MMAETAAALRRNKAAAARAKTAAAARRAAVADDQAQLGQRRNQKKVPLPPVCSFRRRSSSGTVQHTVSPATKVTAPSTRPWPSGPGPTRAAARVTRIRPRRYSAVMNIVATTISAISPANVPQGTRRWRKAAVPRAVRGDVAGPGDGEIAAGLAEPTGVAGEVAGYAAPHARRSRAAGGAPERLEWSKAAVAWEARRRAGPVPMDCDHPAGIRGCREQPGLHGRGQSGQGDRADPGPVLPSAES